MKGYHDILEPRAQSLMAHSDPGVREWAVESIKEIEVFERSEDCYRYVFYLLQRA